MATNAQHYGATGRLPQGHNPVDKRVKNGAAIANQARENAKKPSKANKTNKK